MGPLSRDVMLREEGSHPSLGCAMSSAFAFADMDTTQTQTTTVSRKGPETTFCSGSS